MSDFIEKLENTSATCTKYVDMVLEGPEGFCKALKFVGTDPVVISIVQQTLLGGSKDHGTQFGTDFPKLMRDAAEAGIDSKLTELPNWIDESALEDSMTYGEAILGTITEMLESFENYIILYEDGVVGPFQGVDKMDLQLGLRHTIFVLGVVLTAMLHYFDSLRDYLAVTPKELEEEMTKESLLSSLDELLEEAHVCFLHNEMQKSEHTVH